jgi:hypothetical protein
LKYANNNQAPNQKVASMTSSIGTQSVGSLSIFSHSESHLSANTRWTSDLSIKLDDGGGELNRDDPHKQGRQMGRPQNKWTRARLRKLTKLYLLTDLELDGIIDRLRSDDFQPWLAFPIIFDRMKPQLTTLQQAQCTGETQPSFAASTKQDPAQGGHESPSSAAS